MLDTVKYCSCHHCQTVVPTARAIDAEIEGQRQRFCCHGCRAAAEFIVALELESFYQYRDKCDIPPAPVNTEQTTLPSPGKALTQGDDGLWELRLLIPDIRCAACVWLLEQVLNREAFVASVQINFSNRRMLLRFRAECSGPEQETRAAAELLAGQVLHLIRRLGYEARPDQPDLARSAWLQSRRNLLLRLGVAGIGSMPVMMFAIASYLAAGSMDPVTETLMRWGSLALSTPVVLYSAFPFHRGAWYALRNRQLGMDVPVSLAIAAAWLLSLVNTVTAAPEVYFDTACMFTFFLLCGRYVELMSTWHFQQSQDMLTGLLPATVLRIPGGGSASEQEKTAERIALQDICPDDVLPVSAGEIIPADGIILSGSASISEAAFTGEPLPLLKTPGDRVLAGARNHDGELLIRASSAPEHFLVTRLARLCEQASHYRPRWSQLADRAASAFIAAVLLIALGTAVYWYQAGASDFLIIALTVLVVACPCALSLATPVAYTMAVTALRRHGLLVRKGAFLERAAETDSVIFDKTGTLTEASLELVETHPLAALDADTCLALASALEQHSEHPVARAFHEATSLHCESPKVVPGGGVAGVIGGRQYRIGHADFVLAGCAPDTRLSPPDERGLWVLLAGEAPLAWFRLRDALRQDASSLIRTLREQGYHTGIISGDCSSDGLALCRELAADHHECGATPERKIEAVRALQQQGRQVMMVGDGINDTGALAAADTSIAVMARDSFVQGSADALLLNSSLLVIPEVLVFAHKVRRIIRQNILWSLCYNFTVIPFAVTGMIAPWLAALGMSLSSLLVVLNATRLQRVDTPRMEA